MEKIKKCVIFAIGSLTKPHLFGRGISFLSFLNPSAKLGIIFNTSKHFEKKFKQFFENFLKKASDALVWHYDC